jgi:hypothetical protein
MIASGMTTKRILVTGSRDWEDYFRIGSEIVRAMQDLTPIQPGQYNYNDGRYVIVHGACPTGADYLADQWALGSLTDVERHPADWKRYGRAAGFKRNAEMVKLGADICLAFIRNESRGATHTANLAELVGIPTRRFTA